MSLDELFQFLINKTTARPPIFKPNFTEKLFQTTVLNKKNQTQYIRLFEKEKRHFEA